MAVRAVGSAIGDLAGAGDGALDGVEVFADFTADRDAEEALFEGGAEAGKEFGFQSGGEGAEVETGPGGGLGLAGARPSEVGASEFAGEVVAEADAGAGVVEADFAAALEARTEDFELFGGGGVFEAEHFAGDKQLRSADFRTEWDWDLELIRESSRR
jgi:hypothetical protein